MTPEKPRHDGEWVSVPRKPTHAMLEALCDTNLERAYSNMLVASPATAALGTQEGESAEQKEQFYRTAFEQAQKSVGEKLCTIASQARTIEALRAVADQIGRVQPDNWLTESDDYRRGASDTILRYAPLILALKEHPNG